jgi:hypothetical protein
LHTPNITRVEDLKSKINNGPSLFCVSFTP